MRQLLENSVYAPARGRFKVYVIDEVHMLSTSAFNAMLKTLEEPPEHIKFILATTDPQKIPVTVLSRCLQFNLKQMPSPAIADHLGRILAEEKTPAEGAALALLADCARGSMRDALSLLDQAIAYGGGKVTEQAVRSMLGAIDETYLYSILEGLARGDAAAVLAVAEDMRSRSVAFDGALQDLGALLHRVALAQAAPDAVKSEGSLGERLAALARTLDPEEVSSIIRSRSTAGRIFRLLRTSSPASPLRCCACSPSPRGCAARASWGEAARREASAPRRKSGWPIRRRPLRARSTATGRNSPIRSISGELVSTSPGGGSPSLSTANS